MTTRHVWMRCKNCSRVFEIGDGPTPCPECSSPVQPTWTQVSNLLLQEKLYGTTNNPVFNIGLGTYTTGKRDRDRKADQRKLAPSG